MHGQAAASSSTAVSAHLTVSGDVEKPLSLSMDDLRRLPRQTISVKNEHAAKMKSTKGRPWRDF